MATTAGLRSTSPLPGAALFGLRQSARNHRETSSVMTLEELKSFDQKIVSVKCGGCGNHCQLTVNTFADGRKFISGNRCDKPVTGKSEDPFCFGSCRWGPCFLQ